MVWKLDHLPRSLKQLIETVEMLAEREIGFRSLTENIDTTSSGGRLIFHVFGALAEFERSIIRQRTTAGLVAARARGRVRGRPRSLSEEDIHIAKALLRDGKLTIAKLRNGSMWRRPHCTNTSQDPAPPSRCKNHPKKIAVIIQRGQLWLRMPTMGRNPTFKLFEQNSACALTLAAFLPPAGAVSWARMTPLPTLECAQFPGEKAALTCY